MATKISIKNNELSLEKQPQVAASMRNTKTQRGYLDMNFGAFFAGLIACGVAIGIVVCWLAPVVWGWLKPLIHGATA